MYMGSPERKTQKYRGFAIEIATEMLNTNRLCERYTQTLFTETRCYRDTVLYPKDRHKIFFGKYILP
jgi:hypothetical protein